MTTVVNMQDYRQQMHDRKDVISEVINCKRYSESLMKLSKIVYDHIIDHDTNGGAIDEDQVEMVENTIHAMSTKHSKQFDAIQTDIERTIGEIEAHSHMSSGIQLVQ